MPRPAQPGAPLVGLALAALLLVLCCYFVCIMLVSCWFYVGILLILCWYYVGTMFKHLASKQYCSGPMEKQARRPKLIKHSAPQIEANIGAQISRTFSAPNRRATRRAKLKQRPKLKQNSKLRIEEKPGFCIKTHPSNLDTHWCLNE